MIGAEFDPNAPQARSLSPLELEIWTEKQKGASNLEVALKLFLYESTVKRHLETISQKVQGWPRRRRLLNGGV